MKSSFADPLSTCRELRRTWFGVESHKKVSASPEFVIRGVLEILIVMSLIYGLSDWGFRVSGFGATCEYGV